MTPALATYLRGFVEPAFDEVAVPHTVSEEFNRFRDVMIADGTVLRLHGLLSAEDEGRREEQAGERLHLLHNVTDQTIDRFNVIDEK